MKTSQVESCINYYPRESLSDLKTGIIQIPSPLTETLKTPENEENETLEIISETIKELQDEVEALTERVEHEKEEVHNWKRQYYEQIERGNNFRNKFLDMERQHQNVAQRLEVETANRKMADKRADDSLTAAYRDELLTVEVMRKVVQMAERAKGE